MSEQTIQQFFLGLSTGLEYVKTLESQFRRELDRNFAARFNYFDYISTDELGLSKIISDLLNPNQNHGQQYLFLNELIRLFTTLGNSSITLPPDVSTIKNSSVLVTTEKYIDNGRRIDILIEFATSAETYCIAIENKPFAGDQENQIKDYLKYLVKKFGDYFLLIYLSSYGEPPDEHSVDINYLNANGIEGNRFAILPFVYYRDESDELEQYRVQFSFVEWLTGCQKLCVAQRLRLFLQDFEKYCQNEFGEQTMTTHGEKEFIKSFLMKNPENLKYALAVSESWSELCSETFKNFLNLLCIRIKEAIEESPDLAPYKQKFRITKEYKTKNEGKHSYVGLVLKSRSANDNSSTIEEEYCWIQFGADEEGPDLWWLGVHITNTNDMFRNLICHEISSRYPDWRKRYANCNVYSYLKDLDWGRNNSIGDWSKLVREIIGECESEEGKILNLYVNEFVEFAKLTLPRIDEIRNEYIRAK